MIDRIANLKISLNHRLKLIEKIYNFNKFNFLIKHKDHLLNDFNFDAFDEYNNQTHYIGIVEID